MPGDFHPITAYLFLDYKCNLDCWYCWAFNNKVKGMTEVWRKQGSDLTSLRVKDLLGCDHCVAVNRYRVFNVLGIAARIRHHDWNLPRLGDAEHQFVPLLQSLDGQ